MSSSVRYDWALQAELRRQEYLSRILENTSRFLRRYQALYDDLVRQGFDEYLPGEFEQVRERLDAAQTVLGVDPESARDISMSLGHTIAHLQSLAREAKREFEARYRERQRLLQEQQREAQTAFEAFMSETTASFKDPVVRDFAYEDLCALRAEFGDKRVEPSALSRVRKQVAARVEEIRKVAEEKAATWKREKEKAVRVETQQTLLDIHREEAAKVVDENPEAINNVLAGLVSLSGRLRGGAAMSAGDFAREMKQAVVSVDEAVVDERCRKATVKAILASLAKAGFVTDTPRREKGEKDEVVVIARKPAGQQAVFRVTVAGAMTYRFDHYEGMKCKDDIDKVLPLLQQIYGVRLSNENVLWRNNPDRISKSARPLDMGPEERRHGK